MTGNNTDRICGTGFTEEDFEEGLEAYLPRLGIEVTNVRTEPFGNADCTCGSGKRYDSCCSPRKMNSLF